MNWSRPYQLVTVSGAQLFSAGYQTPLGIIIEGAGSGPARSSGGAWGVLAASDNVAYQGISLDPSTQCRQVLVWFDDDDTAIPLCGSAVIARPFRRLAVAPLYDYLASAGSLSLPSVTGSASSPASLLLRPQALRLRVWRSKPEPLAEILPPSFRYASPLFTVGGHLPAGTVVGVFHLPGATRLRYWAYGLGNGASGVTTTMQLQAYAVPCEVQDGETVVTGAAQLVGSLALGVGITATAATGTTPVVAQETLVDFANHEIALVAATTQRNLPEQAGGGEYSSGTWRFGVHADFGIGA